MHLNTLQELGLSEKEAKVYLASIEIGPATAFEISKKAGIHHSTAYLELDKLKKKGLASNYEQKGKIIFTCESPEGLFKLIEAEKQKLEDKEKLLKENFSDLRTIFLKGDNQPKVKVYEGIKGYEQIEYDASQVDKNAYKTVYSFTALDVSDQFKPINIISKDRVKRGTELKMLYTHKDGVKYLSDRSKLREARFLPRDQYPFDGAIVIAPNHSVRLYSFKNNFIGFWIFNPDIANTLKMIFDVFWEIAEKEIK